MTASFSEIKTIIQLMHSGVAPIERTYSVHTNSTIIDSQIETRTEKALAHVSIL